MTDDEIAALRAAAEKAADAEEDWYGAEYFEGALNRPPQDIDATYIAAASPAAVLALLDEREALRAALRSIDRRDTYNADSYGQFAQIARAALRAQAEAAGVTAALLSDMARHHDVVATRLGVEWDRHGYDADKPHRQMAAFLRALAEVLRDE